VELAAPETGGLRVALALVERRHPEARARRAAARVARGVDRDQELARPGPTLLAGECAVFPGEGDLVLGAPHEVRVIKGAAPVDVELLDPEAVVVGRRVRRRELRRGLAGG